MSDIEHVAIERLKAASEMSLQHYGTPLVITDSGGKDSSVCKELALQAGIPFEIIHNHTTADAPETVRFVRSEAKRFENMGIKYTINMPTYKGQRTSMWGLIPQKLMPPTRFVRYCCSVLKENGGTGRFVATGVRWAESSSRKNNRGIYEKLGSTVASKIILNNDNDDKRLLFENCRLKAKRVVNPIVDWKDDDVWQFLNDAMVIVSTMSLKQTDMISVPTEKGKAMREKLIELLDDFGVYDDWYGNGEIADHLIAHGVTVQECGHWVYDFNLAGSNFYRCSVCDRQETLLEKEDIYEYCPFCHCGAKMMPQPPKGE